MNARPQQLGELVAILLVLYEDVIEHPAANQANIIARTRSSLARRLRLAVSSTTPIFSALPNSFHSLVYAVLSSSRFLIASSSATKASAFQQQLWLKVLSNYWGVWLQAMPG